MKTSLRLILFASVLLQTASLAWTQPVEKPSSITVTCPYPPFATYEREFCGTAENNNACDGTLIGCGVTFCGNVWADTNARDIDCYKWIYFTPDTGVTYWVVAEFPVEISIFEYNGCGIPDVRLAIDTAQPGDTARITRILPTGNYIFTIMPTVLNGIPCSNPDKDYIARLECQSPPAKDNCADAAGLSGEVTNLAFSTMGATTDGPDDPLACNYNGYTHIESDVWFCYTPTCTGIATVSLCGSSFDTKLAVYESCVCPVSVPPIVCNDNACGQQSEAVFPVTAGNQYLIRIGGFNGVQGTGFLTVRCCPGISCPPRAIAEDEPCGAEGNGGCGSIPPLFHFIDFGDTVCGTVWAENGSADTDWYQKTLAESSDVNWIVTAEFPFKIAIFDSACPGDTIASSGAIACASARIWTTLPPGTYNLLVAPSHTDGLSCSTGPHQYSALLLSCPFEKGDLNGSRDFTPADVVATLHCVYLQPWPQCELCFADLNCDGIYTPSDLVLELNLVFLNIQPPCQL